MSNLQNNIIEEQIVEGLTDEELARVCYKNKTVWDYYEDGMKIKQVIQVIKNDR